MSSESDGGRRKLRVAVALSVLVLLLLAAGSLLAVAGRRKGFESQAFQVSKAAIRSILVDASGHRALIVHGVSDSDPGPVSVVDLDESRVLGIVGTEHGIVGPVAVSADGELLAWGAAAVGGGGQRRRQASEVEVWSVRHANRIAHYPADGVEGLAFTPDGRALVEERVSGTLEYRDLATGTIARTVARSGAEPLYRCGRDHLLVRTKPNLECWSVAKGALLPSTLPAGSSYFLAASTAVPVLAQFDDARKNLLVQSCPDGRTLASLPLAHDGWTIALAPEGDLVAALTYDAEARMFLEVFSVAAARRITTVSYGVREATATAFVPGSDTLLVGTSSGRLEVHPLPR